MHRHNTCRSVTCTQNIEGILRESDYTKYALVIIIYKKQSSENG